MANLKHILTFVLSSMLIFTDKISCQVDPRALELTYLLENRSEIALCKDKYTSSLSWDTCYNTPLTSYGGDFTKEDVPSPTQIILESKLNASNRNCFCDKSCLKYGDCCIDVALKHQQWKHKEEKWVCSELPGSHSDIRQLYTIGKCGPSWKVRDGDVRSRCEMDPTIDNYYIQHIPVVSNTTKLFYRNIFCAICNDDSENIVQWETTITCNLNIPLEELASEGQFKYDNFDTKTYSWKTPDGYGDYDECFLQISDFTNNNTELASKYDVRPCKLVIDSCPVVDNEDAARCKLYSSYVYREEQGYKNFYCAKCNNVSFSELSCQNWIRVPSRSFSGTSFSVLFDFNVKSGQLVDKSGNTCKQGTIYDPMRQRCIGVQCGRLYKLQNGKCILYEDSVKTNSSLHSNCFAVKLLSDEFSLLPNGTVWVNLTKKLYGVGEYELTDPLNVSYSELLICKEDHLLPLFKFSSAQGVLSQVCLSISILSLLVHVILYAIIPKLRNLPGQSLLCLSCSLLFGQLIFLFGVNSTESHPSCVFIGIVLHFFFLSYFFWMNVMAIDICYTFRSNSYRSNPSRKMFIKYSCYAWLTPLGIIILGVIFDYVKDFELSFRPGYGNGLCWINHKKALILLFIVPVAIIMIMNISMFSLTAYHIKKSYEASEKAIKRSEKTRYLLYIKLSIIMGLTWLFAFIAALVESEATWYLYIILNGLQGVFIFISFSCKKKVFKLAIDSISSISVTDTSVSSKGKKTQSTNIIANNSLDGMNHSGSNHNHNLSNSKMSMQDLVVKIDTANDLSNSESNV